MMTYGSGLVLPQIKNIAIFVENDTGLILTGLAMIGSLALTIFVLSMYGRYRKKHRDRDLLGGGLGQEDLDQLFREYGLNKKEIEIFNQVVSDQDITVSRSLFNNPERFNRYLEKAVTQIEGREADEEDKNRLQSLLFQIRHKLELKNIRRKALSRSNRIALGTSLLVGLRNTERLPAKVIVNERSGIRVQIQNEVAASQMSAFVKGEKVQVLFWDSYGQRYYFHSKIIEVDQLRTYRLIKLSHSWRLTVTEQRSALRYEIDLPCQFFLVKLIKDGNTARGVVSKTSLLGNIREISAGGCSVTANHPLPEQSLLKIIFDSPQIDSITVVGKVINLNLFNDENGIMHIRFSRISEEALNRINRLIYKVKIQ